VGEVSKSKLYIYKGRYIQWTQGPGTKDLGPRTWDQGPGTKDSGPRTRDQGPRTKDPGPRTQDQGPGTWNGIYHMSITGLEWWKGMGTDYGILKKRPIAIPLHWGGIHASSSNS